MSLTGQEKSKEFFIPVIYEKSKREENKGTKLKINRRKKESRTRKKIRPPNGKTRQPTGHRGRLAHAEGDGRVDPLPGRSLRADRQGQPARPV